VLFVSRVGLCIRFWDEKVLANRAPLNDLNLNLYYLRSSENIQNWVNWQRLPRLHSVGISGTFRKFWSACRCLMTWLEWMWNHRWWQTSAFHNPPILWNGLSVLLNPSALLTLLLAHRENYCHLWRSAIERKREGAKLPFEGTLNVMILPTRTSGWRHQPWQLWMALLREPLLWLTQQYSMSLTKNKEQEQFLRIVNNHRKTYRSCSKATLMKMTEDSA